MCFPEIARKSVLAGSSASSPLSRRPLCYRPIDRNPTKKRAHLSDKRHSRQKYYGGISYSVRSPSLAAHFASFSRPDHAPPNVQIFSIIVSCYLLVIVLLHRKVNILFCSVLSCETTTDAVKESRILEHCCFISNSVSHPHTVEHPRHCRNP